MLLFFDGFDYLPATGITPITKPGWILAGNFRSDPGRFGGYAITASASTGTGRLQYGFASPVTTAIVGVAVKTMTNPFGSSAWGIRLSGDNGATNHLTVNWDATGHLVLRRGTASGTIIATSTNQWVYDTSAWHYIEIKATIADAGGTCIVKVDGVEWINFTGDTKNGGTNNSIDMVDFAASSSGGTTTIAWDDVYILDGTGAAPYNDFLGDIKVERLLPNGNGASSQWVGSDGNSTDNYLLVDDPTPDSTDYVQSSVVGDRDLYALSDLVSTSGTVLATQVSASASKSDAGSANIKTLTRASSGTVSASNAIALGVGFTLLAGPVRTLDPDGAAWTIANINAMQAGIESA